MPMRSALAAAVLIAVAATNVAAQGCAMCGTAFTPDDPTTRAFGWSILFLIAMPYTLFGVVTGWLVVAHRRRVRRAAVIALRAAPVPDEPEGGLS